MGFFFFSLGTHTIGKAHCKLFRNRIYNEANINDGFARSKQKICPREGGGMNLSGMDGTPDVFDNIYFRHLKDNKGLFHSDQQLYSGGSTDSLVLSYSTHPTYFFADVAKAMVKMGNLSLLTGTQGEIRTKCWKINGS